MSLLVPAGIQANTYLRMLNNFKLLTSNCCAILPYKQHAHLVYNTTVLSDECYFIILLHFYSTKLLVIKLFSHESASVLNILVFLLLQLSTLKANIASKQIYLCIYMQINGHRRFL